jgi:hypothetical protein
VVKKVNPPLEGVDFLPRLLTQEGIGGSGMRYKSSKPKGVALTQHVTETPLAKRMKAALGEDEFQVLKTFQQHLGARVLHYQDAEGEVGRKPTWG